MRGELTVVRCVGAVALLCGALIAHAQADLVLHNGKVVTVDERFTIAHALAIKGDRIIDVGTTPQIRMLAGANTKVVDLKGKTVIPGLIDNHAHFMRSVEYWDREVRLDGVTSRKQALEMLLTGEFIDAQTALQWGLVNRVVPAGHDRHEAIELARKITSKSALTLKTGKEAFYRQLDMTLTDAYRYASAVMVENMMRRDAKEGIGAFVEKREPRWDD